jgi:xylulokinase
MASTLGVGAARPGDAVLTVGTSGVACIVDHAFHPGPEAAILTSAHAAPETFLSMGVVMSATASLDWSARITGTDARTLAAEAEGFAAGGRLADAPVFLPTLTGIRTPLNRPDALGAMAGLHPETTRAMLGYATMEGVAFQFADCIAAQEAAGVHAANVASVGGGTRSRLWVSLIATRLGRDIALPPGAHVAATLGAARLGAVAAGAPVSTLGLRPPAERVVPPDEALAPVLAERYERYRALLPEKG